MEKGLEWFLNNDAFFEKEFIRAASIIASIRNMESCLNNNSYKLFIHSICAEAFCKNYFNPTSIYSYHIVNIDTMGYDMKIIIYSTNNGDKIDEFNISVKSNYSGISNGYGRKKIRKGSNIIVSNKIGNDFSGNHFDNITNSFHYLLNIQHNSMMPMVGLISNEKLKKENFKNIGSNIIVNVDYNSWNYKKSLSILSYEKPLIKDGLDGFAAELVDKMRKLYDPK